MSAWLGIAILVTFSVGLSLFMRLERSAEHSLAPELQRWRRRGEAAADGSYVEARVWKLESRWFGKARYVEQQRRRAATGEILEVLPERAFHLERG